MQTWPDSAQEWLTEHTLKVLKQNVAYNGSALPPFRLSSVARQIVSGLIGFARAGSASVARTIGEGLGRAGLGLRSITAVHRALVRASLMQAEAEQVSVVQDYVSLLAEGVAEAEMKLLTEQRDEMQTLLQRAIESRELELRGVIQQLSTPIMPVHEQILVLPLVGAIDEERAQRITERLLDAVCQRRARIVIIDITGVAEFDTAVADGLLRAAGAVHLLGAHVLLVGIRPELALSLIQRDIDLGGLVTLADLQSGISYALRQQGLGVYAAAAQPQRSRRRNQGERP
jgi:rsbT co-antagonist protein RsbR